MRFFYVEVHPGLTLKLLNSHGDGLFLYKIAIPHPMLRLVFSLLFSNSGTRRNRILQCWDKKSKMCIKTTLRLLFCLDFCFIYKGGRHGKRKWHRKLACHEFFEVSAESIVLSDWRIFLPPPSVLYLTSFRHCFNLFPWEVFIKSLTCKSKIPFFAHFEHAAPLWHIFRVTFQWLRLNHQPEGVWESK